MDGEAIWRSAVIGRHGHPAHVDREIRRRGAYVSTYTDTMLESTAFHDKPKILHLVARTWEQLGFRVEGEHFRMTKLEYEKLRREALARGLYDCPQELGPVLRADWVDQKVGTQAVMAMEPVVNSRGRAGIWVLERNSALWLTAHYVACRRAYHKDTPFIFATEPA